MRTGISQQDTRFTNAHKEFQEKIIGALVAFEALCESRIKKTFAEKLLYSELASLVFVL